MLLLKDLLPREVLEKIKKELKSEGILLFGSYARGESKKSSDIDLLVLSSRPASKEKIIELEKKIRKDYGIEVDLWVMHPKKVFLEIVNGNVAMIKLLDESRVVQSSHHTSFLKGVSHRWMKKLRNG